MVWANRLLIDARELKKIVAIVKNRRPCKMLVFGLGNDSLFWIRLNRGGKTLFIEDDKRWHEKITKINPGIKTWSVDYGTQGKQWRELLASPALLKMDFPAAIEKEKWDVILVDGPKGFTENDPGRMKSIAMASKLSGTLTDVLVHDCDREIERTYSEMFLKNENLVTEVNRLRHYRVKDTSSKF